MLNLVKIAVTGGLSSGKTSACRFFKDLGAYVVSADEIVHQLLSPNTTLGKQIIDLLGFDIVVKQQLDRKNIAKKVFNDPLLLGKFEALIHPAVYKEIEQCYCEVMEKQLALLFVAEIPLLFETNGQRFFDYTVAVIAEQNNCIKRFVQSTGYGVDEFERRTALQMSQDNKANQADYVIYNNGTPTDMQAEVRKLFKLFTTSK